MKLIACIILVLSILLSATAQNYVVEFEDEGDQPFVSSSTPPASLQIESGGVNGSALHVTGDINLNSTANWTFARIDNIKAFSFWVKMATYSKVEIRVYDDSLKNYVFAFEFFFFEDGNMGLVNDKRLVQPMPYELNKWYLIEANYPKDTYMSQHIEYAVNGVVVTAGVGTLKEWNNMALALSPGADLYLDQVNIGCPGGCHGNVCRAGSSIFSVCSCDEATSSGFSCYPRPSIALTEENPTHSVLSSEGMLSMLRIDYSAFKYATRIVILSDINVSISHELEDVAYSFVELPGLSTNITLTFPQCTSANKNIVLLSIWSPNFRPFSYNLAAEKIKPQNPLPNGKSVDVTLYDLYFPLEGTGPFRVQYTIANFPGTYIIMYYGTEPCNLTTYLRLDSGRSDQQNSVALTFPTPQDLYFRFSPAGGSVKLAVTASNCDNTQCGGHGVCYNGKCFCSDFYTGENCDVQLCKYMQCGEHGTCILTPGRPEECVCDYGWAGESCECESSGDLNTQNISNVTPNTIGTAYYTIDNSEFPNGFTVTLQSAAPENFKIGNSRACSTSGFQWNSGAVTSRQKCAGYPWSPKPKKSTYVVMVQNLNVFNSYSLVVGDAGPVGTFLAVGQKYTGQYISNYDSNYGPGVRNYTVYVPQGKGVKVEVTINTQPSPTRNIYELIELYGSNYTCASKSNGNAFVSAIGVTKDITIQANCVTDAKFFLTMYNYWQNGADYDIIATTFDTGRTCTGPTPGPNQPTVPPRPTKLVITLNTNCSSLNLADIKAKIEEIVKASVTVTSDCQKRDMFEVVRVTVTLDNNGHVTEKQAQEVKAGLANAGYDIQGFQVVDAMPEPTSSTTSTPNNNDQSPALSLRFSPLVLFAAILFYLSC